MMRKIWAVPMFIISLLGIVVQDIHAFAIADGIAVWGAGAAVLPLVVLVIGVALIRILLEQLGISGVPFGTARLELLGSTIPLGQAFGISSELDVDATARPVGGDGDGVAKCDIGAYEFVIPITPWLMLLLGD